MANHKCRKVTLNPISIYPTLDYAIGNYYEMSVIVRSLCTNDGGLIIPKDKSLPMNMITDIHGSIEEPKDLPTIRLNIQMLKGSFYTQNGFIYPV